MNTIDVAGQMRFVKEATNHNDGPWVEAILRTVDCPKGSPWCAAFVSFCLTIAHNGKNPLPNTASCEALHQFGKQHGLMVERPQAGDVFLVLNEVGHAHHTGFVTASPVDGKVQTLEGNTNVDGSRDGWGVFARSRTMSPRLVFVRPSEPVPRAA